MRAVRWLVAALLSLFVAAGLVWALDTGEPVMPREPFDASVLGDEPSEWLAQRDAAAENLQPGTGSEIVWAGTPGRPTDRVVVYLHGFSASPREIHPVPRRVADALGANLLLMRLTGHGQDGAALAEARASDWVRDTQAAMEIARRLGERTLLIGTSNGGTLAALAAFDPALSESLAGVVLISPNFGLPDEDFVPVILAPGFRWWAPILSDREGGFEPYNEDHARYWTESYPITAVRPVVALMEAAQARRWDQVDIPALFIFSDADAVVSAERTREAAAAWGGPARLAEQPERPGDDPDSHVLAGEILSPAGTEPVTGTIVEWARGL